MPDTKDKAKTSDGHTKTPDELNQERAQRAGAEIEKPEYPIEHPAWAGPEAAGPTSDEDPTRDLPNPEDRSNFAEESLPADGSMTDDGSDSKVKDKSDRKPK